MTLHLKVPKREAQKILVRMREERLMDSRYQIQRDGQFVFIPVIEESGEFLSLPAGSTTIEMEPVHSKSRTLPTTAGGAFDLIGEIAITKIRNRERAARLAESLIENRPGIKAVYLDRGIVGVHRLRDLELLSGENIFLTRYRENGIIFELDVSRVYFSPRLATERMLVARDARDGECIIDLFAGIGAFSINIARLRNANITAIDSNPDAIRYMKRSISLNSLRGNIEPVLGDAREVLKSAPNADRIIMNLPHESSEYIREALGRLKEGGTVHYYEILDMQSLEERMEEFATLGLEIRKKREVHGYSTSLSMYSLTAVKNQE